MKQYKPSTPRESFATAALVLDRGDNMNATPTFACPSLLSITVAAALATFIAIALLTAVVFLFQRDGAPMERLAVAERACTQYVYVSEREACMREWLAAASTRIVASK